MNKDTYRSIENYMLEMAGDSAHDALHIYRVLYQSLSIAKSYNEVNRDVLIASCLLHDIGRESQFNNPKLCHAIEGGKMAYAFMEKLGWDKDLCLHIQDCITTHRFRADSTPKTIEAKILFDSDKLDATGALGIARSLIYKGQIGEPLYTVDKNNKIQNGENPEDPESFLKEYHFKLIRLYDRFYTKEAKAIAQKRKDFTKYFFYELMNEIVIDEIDKFLDDHARGFDAY